MSKKKFQTAEENFSNSLRQASVWPIFYVDIKLRPIMMHSGSRILRNAIESAKEADVKKCWKKLITFHMNSASIPLQIVIIFAKAII